jgi:urea transporter
MTIEEISAWGRYEQTAKTARTARRRTFSVGAPCDLESGQLISSISRHNAISSLSRHGASAYRHLDRSKELSNDSKNSAFSFSGYFDKLNLHQLPTETETPISKTDVPEFSDDILADIRDIFGVYFEGCYAADSLSEHKKDKPLIISFFRSINGTMPWLQPFIEKRLRYSNLFLFIDTCLRGIAQVYFQNNPLSGLFILAGLFLQSSRVAMHGLLAVVGGNLFAFAFGFDKGLIRSGLFGYNAVLVGLALATFDSPTQHTGYYTPTVIASIVFASFSSVLFVMMGKLLVPYKSPPLTFPFNIATLVFLLATADMGRVSFDPVRDPALPDYGSAITGHISGVDFFKGVVRGIGQVYLADNLWSGLLIWAGIAVSSRIGAVAAIIGSMAGAATALATGVSGEAVASGLFGYNASLTFTAMLMFYAPNRGALIMGFIAAIMTVIVQQALATLLEPFGLPLLTLPFCATALPFIILQGTTTLVIAVPLATMTFPEDHLKKVKTLTAGFKLLKEAIRPVNDQSSHTLGVADRNHLSVLSEAIAAPQVMKKATSSAAAGIKRCTSRICQHKRGVLDDPWIIESAPRLFTAFDMDDISLAAFTAALDQAGLCDKESVSFASIVFNLMDLDRLNSMKSREFVAFCLVSRALGAVRHKIAKFFDFVDIDGNSLIHFDEIDASLEYLGEPGLTKADREILVSVLGTKDGIDAMNENDEIDAVELINFVTVATTKNLVLACQRNSDSTDRDNTDQDNTNE